MLSSMTGVGGRTGASGRRFPPGEMNVSVPRYSIHELAPDHRDWPEYVDVVDREGQSGWAFDTRYARYRRLYLMARQDGRVVGFLMYLIWQIGPHDRKHPPLAVSGAPLTEAKIMAFGVKEGYRRQGIGRALQEHVLRQAKALGCYQVRSVSTGGHPQNQRLKLAMGFAVEPMERDTPTLAFIMPLRPAPWSG